MKNLSNELKNLHSTLIKYKVMAFVVAHVEKYSRFTFHSD